MPPRLTIGIPTVNRANLLGRAIESALAQTASEIEILISDNGSTDETPTVIAQYAARRNARTFRHETTISAQGHGKFLIDQARGEFFVGLSDDDFLEPGFATAVLALFDRHPNLSFVYTGCAVHYGDIEVPSLVGPEVESTADFLREYYAGRRELSWCACATRVHLLREFGPQPADFILGDMFFWTKMAFEGPVGCVQRVLSHYVLLRSKSEDNMSHGTPPQVWGYQQKVIADDVLERSRRVGRNGKYLRQLRQECRKFGARSTANQFVWTRIRGLGWAQSVAAVVKCAPLLSLSVAAWGRVCTALLLPPSLLRVLLLRLAKRLGRARGQCETESPMARTAHAS